MQAIQVNLPDNATLKVHLNRAAYFTLPANDPVALEVLSGCAWITQEGDIHDHFLGKGECFNLPGRGEAIVQAVRESEIAVFSRAAEKPAGFVHWLKQFVDDLTRTKPPVLEPGGGSIEAATRCWGNAIARQSATRLGLERTF